MPRHQLHDLMHATSGRLRNLTDLSPFERISTDSRTLQAGDVFWALRGPHHDGHDYVPQALEKGARFCVVDVDAAESLSGPLLTVPDTLTALGEFARSHRERLDALVIGVTGSVGKTTTREFIAAALGAQYRGAASLANFNNLVGLPLSLLSVEDHHEFAVLEMGASAPGDIYALCELAKPEIGVVTAIGPAHLQSFGSLEAIIQTKGELLEQLPPTGFAVLPGDDRILRQMADRAPCPVIFVGAGDDNQIQATDVRVTAGCLQFRCEGTEFEVPVSGRHWLANVLCAIAIGLETGISAKTLAEGLRKFSAVQGRCQLLHVGAWTVIDDTYNASPLAVEAACHLLRDLSGSSSGQSLLVLGDMRELGATAEEAHRRIGELAAELRLDRILACGDYAEDVARGAKALGLQPHQIAATRNCETLLAVLDCWLRPDDVILVKGSRATRMEQVIEWLRERARHDPPRMDENRCCA